MKIIITSPSLNTTQNVSGVASVTNFILKYNAACEYIHFTLGKKDEEKRNVLWLFKIIGAYMNWAFLLIREKNASIHFNFSIDKMAILRDSPLIFLARLFRRRMVIHLHGGELLHQKVPGWLNFILKLNFAGRNPKIVLSHGEEDVLKRKFKCKAVYVLPNCVDIDAAEVFDRQISNSEPLVLLFMGRIALTKGIEYLYQALKTLKTQGFHFRFIMAGKGPAEELYVEKFTELLGADFSFEGVVSGQQKTDLLKSCNVFLLPSFFEGLPMALLESMSFGLVPITTNVGSIKYLVTDGENGLVVNKQSSEDIVNAIRKLSAQPGLMRSISKRARQDVFKACNPSEYVNRLQRIYSYE